MGAPCLSMHFPQSFPTLRSPDLGLKGVGSKSLTHTQSQPARLSLPHDQLSKATRIQKRLGRRPCDGSTYVFRNRRNNRLKVLTMPF